MLMCGVALSAPQLCCCKLRCCGESWPWPHRTLSAGSKLGSYLTSCRLPPSYQQRRALESSSSSAESWEQRSRLWKWATKLSTDHSDDACGVMTSCLTTFQPFLLRTDGDNNSHDLAIFQPSPKCGTKLPTILRVQLQNCQVRWGQLWTWWGCYCQQPVEEIRLCSKWTKSHHLAVRECKY